MSPPTILVINCGSSSLKFAVVEPVTGTVALQGLADRLGSAEAVLRTHDAPPRVLPPSAGPAEVLDHVLPLVEELGVVGVGHRVVHGGEHFSDSVGIDGEVLRNIEACSGLAPLHNPENLRGIQSAQSLFPKLPHVAVFDTAFHQTLPAKAFHYAIPFELYQRFQIRRYGFHGSSHRFVAHAAAEVLGRPLSELQLVTAHLGNGCSTSAILHGKSVETSMGLTPLEGLVMGTRSGDVDPNLHQFIARRTGFSLDQVTNLLNTESGLLGLSGVSNDMRTVLAAAGKNSLAQLAIDVFCYRLARSILSMCAALERIDALVFTGGIGEHATAIRAQTLAELRFLDPRLDEDANRQHGASTNGRITSDRSRLVALVVRTNEELVIAREAARFV